MLALVLPVCRLAFVPGPACGSQGCIIFGETYDVELSETFNTLSESYENGFAYLFNRVWRLGFGLSSKCATGLNPILRCIGVAPRG